MTGSGSDSDSDSDSDPETALKPTPTVHSIAADTDHGAATLSVLALEVLSNRGQVLLEEREAADSSASPGASASASTNSNPTPSEQAEEWDELTALARRLIEARPSMAVLRNRINRAMASVDADRRHAGGLLETVTDEIDRAREADETAAANAATHATGTVLTLSRSATVLEALRAGEPDRVFVAESRPAREGIAVAEALAGDLPVTVHTDAAIAHLLSRESIDCLLVGADTVLADGRLVNKTGTRGAALAATHEGIPVYGVAATDKITDRELNLEFGSQSAVYDGDAPVDIANPTFDVTPADCLEGLITEQGVLSSAAIASVARELAEYESWLEG